MKPQTTLFLDKERQQLERAETMLGVGLNEDAGRAASWRTDFEQIVRQPQRRADRRDTVSSATTPGTTERTALIADVRQGRRIAPQVDAVLAALARMGFVIQHQGGRTVTLHRAA